MKSSISIFIGALIVIMIMFNGTLSATFGYYGANTIIHVVGMLAILLVLLITRSKPKFSKAVPLYFYSAGAIGVFTVLFNNFSFTILGVTIPLALSLLGQSFAAILIDHYGLFEMKVVRFEKKKCVGLCLIFLGIMFMTIY